MVKGLDLFRERFSRFEGAFVLIGGVACAEWFASQEQLFRATKDLDIVLIIEALDQTFINAMREFIEEGGYEIRERTKGRPILYRFAKPASKEFPYMLELFSRQGNTLTLAMGQKIIPIKIEPDHHSLSAILLDNAYYQLIQEHCSEANGVRMANVSALIPLKACAWLDLSARREAGESIDSRNIDKHRSDIFRLAATLPGEAGPTLPDSIVQDLIRFLEALPTESPQWQAILASLKSAFGINFRPEVLRQAIQTYFRLASNE